MQNSGFPLSVSETVTALTKEIKKRESSLGGPLAKSRLLYSVSGTDTTFLYSGKPIPLIKGKQYQWEKSLQNYG